ncbi:DNase I-like protein [Cercophora scortea]|uniref:DNase I-like protein n=1 Tax=Cercophora scortea TaxID=314031 RepID=A0AAE0J552_9PEZI|nr:DNase I-like protein [Cercophora scortea]
MGPRTTAPRSPSSSSTPPAATMTPSTLDLLILTFNCAKNLINAAVFAPHLQAALLENAAGLPDMVVFSLQEVAPLSYAFIGSYFLNPYYARVEEALNLASIGALAATATGGDDSDDGSQHTERQQGKPKPAYTLVRAKNVGMTAVLLFARDPAALQRIEEAECGFGAADMGNKGAVGLRVTWTDRGRGGDHNDDDDGTFELGKTTELTFVATHLAAMEWNLKKRNSNWRTIASGLTFANPRSVLPGVFPPSQAAPTRDRTGNKNLPQTDSTDESEVDDDEAAAASDDYPLLQGGRAELDPEHSSTLQDISIFKPTSHLFVAGDLNYRISETTPPPLAPFPSLDPASDNYFPTFLHRDQLTQERLAGRTLHGLAEAPIGFAPTYKCNVLDDAEGAINEAAVRAGATVHGVAEVPWKFASHRWPGWTDRVLYLDVPGAVGRGVDVRAYDSMPVMRSSDHRPVFLRVSVPVVEAEVMRAALSREVEADGADPRAAPPVKVDVHAWERRAAARQKEIVVGWTALLWSTKEGALVLATLLVLGVSSWWLVRGW